MTVMDSVKRQLKAELLYQKALDNWEWASRKGKPDGWALSILHAAREEKDIVMAGGPSGVSEYGGLL